MKRTNLYLDERQTTALDVRARTDGISRAEVVRRLIDRSLDAEPDELATDLDAIAASFGSLSDRDIASPVRGPDGRAAHLESLRTR